MKLHVAVLFLLLIGVVSPSLGAQIEMIEPIVSGSMRVTQPCDPLKGGSVFFIDIIAAYGSYGGGNHRNSSMSYLTRRYARSEITDGVNPEPNLWWRIRVKRRNPGENVFVAGRRGLKDGILEENGRLTWVRGFDEWNRFGSAPVSRRQGHISVFDFKNWNYFRDRAKRGYTSRRFGIYLEDTPDMTVKTKDVTLADILTLLGNEFELGADRKFAMILLDMSRFQSLTSCFPRKQAKKILRRANRKAGGLKGTLLVNKSKDAGSHSYSYQQAAMAAGFIELLDQPRGSSIRRVNDSYVVNRFIAESSRYDKRAKLHAFELCLRTPRGIDYHEQWIAMVENDEFALDPERKTELLAALREELSSRSPSTLGMISVAFLACFIGLIIFLRVFSRRLMFSR